MSGDLKSEGLTTEGDLTFLVFKSESARFDFLHSEVDPGIQVLHPEVNLGIQVLNPEVDLGIQILHSEADLGISEAAGNHVQGQRSQMTELLASLSIIVILAIGKS